METKIARCTFVPPPSTKSRYAARKETQTIAKSTSTSTRRRGFETSARQTDGGGPGSSRRERLSIALLGATGLPIIVAVTQIGVDEKILDTTQQTVLVAGGMLSVLLFPLIGMALRGERLKASPSLLDDMA